MSKWLGAACGKHSTGGNWMAAAFFAVQSYAAVLSKTSIHLRVDNTATFAWINKQNAPNETVHLLLKE